MRICSFLLALAAVSLSAWSGFAQEKGIAAFLSDEIEIFTEDEDALGVVYVREIDPDQVKILNDNGDMYQLDFPGEDEPVWVFKSDVKPKAGCRVAAAAKAPKAKNASTMGLDGDLCE